MQKVLVKLTSAITVAGTVVVAGNVVEVTDREARDLLNRGKAVLATDDDEAPAIASKTVDPELHPAIAAYQEDREQREAQCQAEPALAPNMAGKRGKPHKETKQSA